MTISIGGYELDQEEYEKLKPEIESYIANGSKGDLKKYILAQMSKSVLQEINKDRETPFELPQKEVQIITWGYRFKKFWYHIVKYFGFKIEEPKPHTKTVGTDWQACFNTVEPFFTDAKTSADRAQKEQEEAFKNRVVEFDEKPTVDNVVAKLNFIINSTPDSPDDYERTFEVHQCRFNCGFGGFKRFFKHEKTEIIFDNFLFHELLWHRDRVDRDFIEDIKNADIELDWNVEVNFDPTLVKIEEEITRLNRVLNNRKKAIERLIMVAKRKSTTPVQPIKKIESSHIILADPNDRELLERELFKERGLVMRKDFKPPRIDIDVTATEAD